MITTLIIIPTTTSHVHLSIRLSHRHPHTQQTNTPHTVPLPACMHACSCKDLSTRPLPPVYLSIYLSICPSLSTCLALPPPSLPQYSIYGAVVGPYNALPSPSYHPTPPFEPSLTLGCIVGAIMGAEPLSVGPLLVCCRAPPPS
jgi:hypothetical protein